MLAVLQKTIESNTIEELVVSLTYLGRGKKLFPLSHWPVNIFLGKR